MVIELTDQQLFLLDWVDAGEVWQEPDGRSIRTSMEYFGVSEIVEIVTEEMAKFEAAGLAVVVEGLYGVRRWVLTDAGREVLAQHDRKEN